MIIEIILALLLGCTIGTFTGLSPGIHINLVSAGLLASLGYFSGVNEITLVVFIVAMAITHTFIDFIPSIFLGAPEEDSFLAVLPGHQLLLEGRGQEAVLLTLFGSLSALPIILIFSFIFIYFLPFVFSFVKGFIAYILIFVSLYLIFREEKFIVSLVIFVLAGFLGLLTFNLPVEEPLLPLLSGLFGVSGLIVSIKAKIKLPRQKLISLRDVGLSKIGFFRSSFAAVISAPLCSFLPGIGSGQAAVIGSEIMGEESRNNRSFLVLIGAINTIVMALSFVTAYAIGKARTGAAAAIKDILEEISLSNLVVIILTVFFAGIFAFFVGVYLSKIFAVNIDKIDYGKLSFIILLILFFVNLLLSNLYGLLVLITGSALGVFAILSGSRRINLMGCLLIPTIVYYLFLQ
ncbi:tripartite tricarboxylate transporter permease [Candidatus Pacearchaeota archaeon]|nr:tripartite tricarboxylate transporter permease [Candidatus Pacearchaeota archaeon]